MSPPKTCLPAGKVVLNLFGELVPAEEPVPASPVEQGLLFETELTEEEKRARKVAERYYAQGGVDLFPKDQDPEKTE